MWHPESQDGEVVRSSDAESPQLESDSASVALEIFISQFYHLEIGRKVIMLKCNFQKGKIMTQKYKINTGYNFYLTHELLREPVRC